MAVVHLPTHPIAWIRSLDPGRTPRQEAPGSASSERPEGQTELTVSVIRLGKTVLVVPSPRRAPLEGSHPRATPEREDASEPPLGPDPERLVFCSLHDVKLPDVAIRAVSDSNLPRSRDRTGRLTRVSLPIRSKSFVWPTASLLEALARDWWVGEELNLRPHAYQACALTT